MKFPLHIRHNLDRSCTGIDSDTGNAAHASLSLDALKLLVTRKASLTGSSKGPMCVKPSYLQQVCSIQFVFSSYLDLCYEANAIRLMRSRSCHTYHNMHGFIVCLLTELSSQNGQSKFANNSNFKVGMRENFLCS